MYQQQQDIFLKSFPFRSQLVCACVYLQAVKQWQILIKLCVV